MNVTLKKTLSAIGKAITFIVIAFCIVLLFAERMHETFFDPVISFVRSLI